MALASLTIDINAKLANLEKDMGKAAHLAEKNAKKMGNAFNLMRTAMTALAGVGVIRLFKGTLDSSIELQDELYHLSKQTGIAADDLAGLKFAADQNGSSLDMVARAIKDMSYRMETTPDKFRKLGINATDATGALIQMSDIVSQMPDGLKKSALLAELLGKDAGPKLAEFLSLGGAAMRDYIERGKGIYQVTEKSADEARKYKDEMAQLQTHLDGLGVSIANKLLPGLVEAAHGMNDAAEAGNALLVVWRGLSAMGKIPYDLLIPPEDIKQSLSSEGMIRDLQAEIGQLQRTKASGSGKLLQWIFGTPEEIDAEISMLTQRIDTIRKHALEIDKSTTAATKPKSSIDQSYKDSGKGDSLIAGLGKDYAGDLARKNRDLNAAAMSSIDKDYLNNLIAVEEKASRVREKIDALNISDAERKKLLAEVTPLVEEQTKAMAALRDQVEANNASWKYGATVAMTGYLEEATNTAKQTEGLFTAAFKGMEDQMAKFFRTGLTDMDAFKNAMLDMLAQIAAKKAMAGLIGMFGGGGYGDTAGVAAGVPRYEGGGFTGYGSRAGGVDGKGGFYAIMHPNETVIDHAQGKSGARSVNVTYAPSIQIDSRSDQAQVRELVDNSVRRGNAELVDQLQRQGAI